MDAHGLNQVRDIVEERIRSLRLTYDFGYFGDLTISLLDVYGTTVSKIEINAYELRRALERGDDL